MWGKENHKERSDLALKVMGGGASQCTKHHQNNLKDIKSFKKMPVPRDGLKITSVFSINLLILCFLICANDAFFLSYVRYFCKCEFKQIHLVPHPMKQLPESVPCINYGAATKFRWLKSSLLLIMVHLSFVPARCNMSECKSLHSICKWLKSEDRTEVTIGK